MLYIVLVYHGGSIAIEPKLCKQYLVHFRRVNGLIKFEHVLDLEYENSEVLLLVAPIIKRHKDGLLHRQFDRSGLF